MPNTVAQMNKFYQEAPDIQYLAHKVWIPIKIFSVQICALSFSYKFHKKYAQTTHKYKYLQNVYFFKVILIFELYGALRKCEFLNVKVTDVSNQGNLLLINIAETKTDKPRAFIIPEKDVSIVNKYISLRPNKAKSDRFFLRYQMGKCTCQVIGTHKLESIPREIASFLNLETVDEYTTHAFRRTSATFLADAGADNLALKRHGGWKQGYIEESVEKKTP